jgi:hypothetical protein
MKSETSSAAETGNSNARPIIVDLGKIGGKKAKELKKGEGIYLEEVVPAVEQVRTSLSKADSGKDVVTVVVIYEKKSKHLRLFPGLL